LAHSRRSGRALGATVYTWYADGMATAGTSATLDAKRTQFAYALPPGYTVSKQSSAGTTSDLAAYIAPRPFALARGQRVSDLLGLAIAPDDWVYYAWYQGGFASAGKSTRLDLRRGLYPFVSRLRVIEPSESLNEGDVAAVATMY
jgi:hypothetical protein